MKKIGLLIAVLGFAFILQGCVVHPHGNYGAGYNGYNNGYQPYGSDGYGRGNGGGHHGWRDGGGRGWNGGGHHGWGGGHRHR